MTKENKQFIQAMGIILKKDVLPWIVAIGAYAGFVWYLNANKNKTDSDFTSVKNSVIAPNNINSGLFNPFESKTR